ncbi:hypothetical protein FS837_001798, partial [Tulasnella sp. UAMH 9824]
MAIFKKKQPPEPTDEKPVKDGESSEKGSNGEDHAPNKETENKLPPVGFTELFRYSTKFELFLDFIGLVCAAASGASQ